MLRLTLVLWALVAFPLHAANLQVIGMTNKAFDVQQADAAIGCTHRISGTFNTGDSARIARELRSSVYGWREAGTYGSIVVCLDSPGGNIAEALALAAVFREEAFGTKLEAGTRCESACALLFMAGSFYAHESGLYKWRVMHPTAQLGFHAPSLQVQNGQYSAATVTKSYALAMETLARTIEDLMQNRGFEDGEHVKPSLIAAMLRTPPDKMMYITTVDQAGRWGIQVGPLRNAPITMRDMDFRRACANKTAWDADESAAEIDEWWSENFVNWSADQWSDKVEVIMNDMTGEGCTYNVPKGASARKAAALNDVQYGFVELIEVLDPRSRLRDLPH